MKGSFLRAGKTLLIPLPQNHQIALRSADKPKKYTGNKHTHTVRSGESLWTIAKYYNTSPRKLCEWNGISIRKPIYKGQQLVIQSNQYGRKVSYTLKEGESLWVVAQKYRVTTQELCNWNGIKKSAVLQPGTKLKVWVKS
jgi:membrane-bound lytic murein transglycosylase D